MIETLDTVCIFVADQDRAKAFYTENLGFEVREDAPMGESRWIAVAPPRGQTSVILYKMDANWQHYSKVMGKSQALTFRVSNIAELAADLKARGVRITQEPDPQPWGTYMMILDADDNGLLLVEPPR